MGKESGVLSFYHGGEEGKAQQRLLDENGVQHPYELDLLDAEDGGGRKAEWWRLQRLIEQKPVAFTIPKGLL